MDQTMTLWTRQLHYGPDNDAMDQTMTLWTRQLHYGPDNYTMDQTITLWTRQSIWTFNPHNINIQYLEQDFRLFNTIYDSMNKIRLWTIQ